MPYATDRQTDRPTDVFRPPSYTSKEEFSPAWRAHFRPGLGGEGISPGSCLLRSEALCLQHALNNVLHGCGSTRCANTEEMFDAARALAARSLKSTGMYYEFHRDGGFRKWVLHGCTQRSRGAGPGREAGLGGPGRGRGGARVHFVALCAPGGAAKGAEHIHLLGTCPASPARGPPALAQPGGCHRRRAHLRKESLTFKSLGSGCHNTCRVAGWRTVWRRAAP